MINNLRLVLDVESQPGNQGKMAEAEEWQLDYLFKLRQTKTVKALYEGLSFQAEWQNTGNS